MRTPAAALSVPRTATTSHTREYHGIRPHAAPERGRLNMQQHQPPVTIHITVRYGIPPWRACPACQFEVPVPRRRYTGPAAGQVDRAETKTRHDRREGTKHFDDSHLICREGRFLSCVHVYARVPLSLRHPPPPPMERSGELSAQLHAEHLHGFVAHGKLWRTRGMRTRSR